MKIMQIIYRNMLQCICSWATGENIANRTTRPETSSRCYQPRRNGREDSDGRNAGQHQVRPGAVGQGGSEGARGIVDAGTPVGDCQGGGGREVGVMHLPEYGLIGYRATKAAQVAAFFLSKVPQGMDKLKLIKLIYLAERESIRSRGRPMIYDEYYSLKDGPICSNTLDGINHSSRKDVWAEYVEKDGNRNRRQVRVFNPEAMDELSKSDFSVLNSVWDQFGWMDTGNIRNWTHKHCAEYTEINSGRIPINLNAMAAALGIENAQCVDEHVTEYRSAMAAVCR